MLILKESITIIKDIELIHIHLQLGFLVEVLYWKPTYIDYRKEVTFVEHQEESTNE
jgi:hypothetical protein